MRTQAFWAWRNASESSELRARRDRTLEPATQAYDASRYVIEEIKKRLPVWKREHYTAGHSEWVEGVKPTPKRTATVGEAAR